MNNQESSCQLVGVIESLFTMEISSSGFKASDNLSSCIHFTHLQNLHRPPSTKACVTGKRKAEHDRNCWQMRGRHRNVKEKEHEKGTTKKSVQNNQCLQPTKTFKAWGYQNPNPLLSNQQQAYNHLMQHNYTKSIISIKAQVGLKADERLTLLLGRFGSESK